MKNILVSLFFVFAATSSSFSEQDSQTPKTDTLTVATYNINFANRNWEQVIDAVLQSKADIIALQETTLKNENYLKRRLHKQYPYTVFVGYKGRYFAERLGLLSKYPITTQRYLEPKHGLFGTLFCTVDIKGQSTQIVNIHLCPANLSQNKSLFQNIKAILENAAIHDKEIKEIVAQLKGDLRTIILGDFNSTGQSPAQMYLAEKGYSDSFAACYENPQAYPTWNWRLNNRNITLRLDYIFYDINFKATHCNVIKNNSSDHYLIVSQLEPIAGNDHPK